MLGNQPCSGLQYFETIAKITPMPVLRHFFRASIYPIALKTALVGLVVYWIAYEVRWSVKIARKAADDALALACRAKLEPPDDPEQFRLYLPKSLYAYPGHELRLHFENIVPPERFRQLTFKVESPFGATSRRYWSATFTPEQVGTHPLSIVVADLGGKELLRGQTEVHVAPIRAGEGKALRLLIVGDSLTHATFYPNRIDELCSQSGNPQLTMIGTHKLSSARPGVVHEGYNGWTWWHFLMYHSPGTHSHGTPDKSPFLYVGADGKPRLDIGRYLRETSPAGPPDLVIFQLGINDAFSSLAEDDIFLPGVDFILPKVEELLAAFRQAAPNAALAIWLTQPVNATQESFDHSYRGLVDYAGLKRSKIALRQHRLAGKLMKHYGEREGEGVFVIPMCATVDPLDDYDALDSVHPCFAGYRRIGESVYAWMKWWLASGAASAERLAAIETPADDSSSPTIALTDHQERR